MSAIIDVEGIGEVFAEKLKEAGIATTGALLKEGATPAGRKKIEKATGIGHKLILRWTNHVDLYRIKGVQKQYAELLEASGVDSILELAKRDPAHLLPKMVATNEKKEPGPQAADAKTGRRLGRAGQEAAPCDDLLT